MASADRTKVIEDGRLSIPLRGLPEPPSPPAAPGPAPATHAARPPEPAAATAGAAASAQYAGAVGRLGVTIAPSTEIYRQRDPRSQLLTRLPMNYYLAVKGQSGGYYAVLMIDGSIGWIPATSVQLLAYDVVADTRRPEASPSFGPPVQGLAGSVVREAYNYLGVPYSWGGNTHRGIDCSGLVKNVFAKCGVPLPRTASQQARVGMHVPVSDPHGLQPGDRLYFSVKHRSIDHTGIYLGNGYFIHASLSRGEVGVDHLSRPLYGRNLVDVRRFGPL